MILLLFVEPTRGILEKGEDTMMTRVFKFSDLEAQSIMIPRTAIIALKDTSTYAQVLEIAQRTRFSYFPVYGENIDDIKGILYLKDLLKYSADNFNIQAVMRPPLFIPGTKKISSVHHVFRERNESMAIVIDEYSGTDGVITKEDIVRQIFGKRPTSTPWRNQASLSEIEDKTSFTLDGTTLLKDLKELLGVELVSDINETLGGWITERQGRLAMPYDSVTIQNIGILSLDIDVTEEVVPHKAIIAFRMLLWQTDILVHIKCHYVLE